MKHTCATFLLALAAVAAQAQMGGSAPPAQQPSGSGAAQQQQPTESLVLDRNLSGTERDVVPAADAMPADKYDFAPNIPGGDFKTVRTFAKQVKHIAATNFACASAVLGEKSPQDTSDDGPDAMKSKDEVMKYLKDSYEYAHKAEKSITPENQLDIVQSPFGPGKTTKLNMGICLISHAMDHYGQMVEYLRMNNIIPPASRPRPQQAPAQQPAAPKK